MNDNKINSLLGSVMLTDLNNSTSVAYSPDLAASGSGQPGYSYLEFATFDPIEALIQASRESLAAQGCITSPTPLISAPRFAKHLGLSEGRIFIKDESRNPTGSFKDRQNEVLFAVAKAFNKRKVRIVSSGNAAISAAYFGVRTNTEVSIAIPQGTSITKRMLLELYGAQLELQGSHYEDTYKTFIAAKDGYWNITPGINPLGEVGLASIGLEIGTQAHNITDILIPSGNGALLYGIWCGLQILSQKNILSHMPRLHAVQIAGFSPIKEALSQRKYVVPLPQTTTIESKAEAIVAIESYCSPKAVKAITASEGSVIEVTDNDIAQYHSLIAKQEGIICEYSAAAAYAACSSLVKKNPKANIVILNCASRLKNLSDFV